MAVRTRKISSSSTGQSDKLNGNGFIQTEYSTELHLNGHGGQKLNGYIKVCSRKHNTNSL